MNIFRSKHKEDSFEDRCSFLGTEMMEMIKDKHDTVGFYINGIYINTQNLSKETIDFVNSFFYNAIPLYITKIERFVSHIDRKEKLNVYLQSVEEKKHDR